MVPADDTRRIALVDLLDRVLGGGVVITGEITLSLADVDMVRISLRTLIASVSALVPRPGRAGPPPMTESEPVDSDAPTDIGRRVLPQRIDADPESVEKGLVTLVLTIVELLRQLMERQAIRRVEHGDLSDEQIERIGTTLMLLEERMAELREHFDLTPEDLNIDLGPLGPLLSNE